MPESSCPICDEVAGRRSAPGGAIYDDGLWLVSHHLGPYTDPGELIVKLRRHSEALADLTAPKPPRSAPSQGAAGLVGAISPSGSTSRRSASECAACTSTCSRTASMPAGHVLSDVYKRGRTLLRGWGIARNPSTVAA
jgi:hypothetical protein